MSALRLAEVGAAPAACWGGGSGGVARGGAGGVKEFCAGVLEAAAAEVTRQEARVDVKAGQVATLAGTLATVAVGAASAVTGVLAAWVPGWWGVVVTAPLVAAGLLWTAAVVVLLRCSVRPHLEGAGRGSFASGAGHLEGLRGMSLAAYRQALVARLDGLVLRRYQAVRLAVDLLVAGFVPLVASGVAAAMLMVVA